MEKMQEKINIEELVLEGVKEIVIRHDNPKIIHEDKTLTLDGSIFAPAEFHTKRSAANYDVLRSHVRYSYELGVIVLVIGDIDFNTKTIKGTTSINPKLAELGINSPKMYTAKELAKLLKFNRPFFVDGEKQQKIIAALQKFHAKINVEIKREDNERGNIQNVFLQTLEHGHDFKFLAACNIYIGSELVQFEVEIVAEKDGNEIKFWFESITLAELLETEKIVLMDSELEKLNVYACIQE